MIKPPPPQQNYEQALAKGLDEFRAQPPENLAELGARKLAAGYELDVLESSFLVDPETGGIELPGGEAPGIAWRILAVHYLGSQPPWPESLKWVSFAELAPAARVYQSVHRGRVLGRLCATAGRDRETFVAACRRVGAEPVGGLGDEAFRFRVFPRVPVTVAWFAGDDEFPPGSSFVYPDNITSFLPLEDVTVLSERLVARLQNGKW